MRFISTLILGVGLVVLAVAIQRWNVEFPPFTAVQPARLETPPPLTVAPKHREPSLSPEDRRAHGIEKVLGIYGKSGDGASAPDVEEF